MDFSATIPNFAADSLEIQNTIPDDEEIQDPTEREKERLHSFIGVSDDAGRGRASEGGPEGRPPYFFVELTPNTLFGQMCKAPLCGVMLLPMEYRIALYPTMHDSWLVVTNDEICDYYHIKCFEQLANLSNRQFLNRLHPLTRKTAHMRAPEDVRDCLLDGGAEKLIVLWKIHRLKRIAVRKGEVYDASETDVDDLFYNAGAPDGFSGGEQYVGKKGVVSEAEYFLSLHQLAPSECEGADDPEPWNLFNSYLIATQKKTLSLAEQHCLSPMLESWERDVKLCTFPDHELTEEEKSAREKMEPKEVRGIRRLALVPPLDCQ